MTRHVLITGASSGIGAALAQVYAAPGIRLSLSGRNAQRLEAVAQACRTQGAIADAQLIDVTDRAAMRRWITEADDTQPLDLVIANAGISGGGSGGEEQERDIFAVNLAGTLNTLYPALERMRAAKRGQLAVMASLAGLRGIPGAAAYSASKAALRSFGEALRIDARADGIKVSVICPGFVKSRITDQNCFRMPFLMEADAAARIIRRGLLRDQARIAFPWPLYAMILALSALPPAWTDPLFARLPRKA